MHALVAVGIGLVFGVLRLINFAYGQLIMVAAYMLVFTQGWPSAASILIAVAAAVFASVGMERIALRPAALRVDVYDPHRDLRDQRVAPERRAPALHV